jgi:hypothetical protein
LPFVCPTCGREIPRDSRVCPYDQTDVGYPNVRAAHDPVEVAALDGRVALGRASAAAQNATAELGAFSDAVATSRAVMNRSLGTLQSWVNDSNPLFLTFHQQVRAGGRLVNDDVWDQQRTSAENTINPNYFEHLHFAALSLDNTGLARYGPYCIVLRDNLIAHRSSVFEENAFFFCRHHAIISGHPAPPGYRAPWGRKSELAIAKLGGKIRAAMVTGDFPDILMGNQRDAPDCDFIEVHIYGPIHTAAIQHVSGPVPANPADRVLWGQTKRKLSALGATWEEL